MSADRYSVTPPFSSLSLFSDRFFFFFLTFMSIPVITLEHTRTLAWAFYEKTVHFQVNSGVSC